MNIATLIARCLSVLAIVGLLAAPTMGSALAAPGAMERPQTSDVASAPMPVMRMQADGMDCRSTGSHPASDCDHGCPWAMLCMAAFTSADPAVEFGLPVAVATPPKRPVSDRDRDRSADGPPARPPRP